MCFFANKELIHPVKSVTNKELIHPVKSVSHIGLHQFKDIWYICKGTCIQKKMLTEFGMHSLTVQEHQLVIPQPIVQKVLRKRLFLKTVQITDHTLC